MLAAVARACNGSGDCSPSSCVLASASQDSGLIGVQRNKALELLDPIFKRFSEGFQTRDLVAAANLLQQLRSRN
jgi:hypothetical protein